MLDIDPRVADGFRDLAGRAPTGAEVWAEAERHVASRRRHRHAMQGGAAAVVIVVGVLVTLGVTHDSQPKSPVAAPLTATSPVSGSLDIVAGVNGRLAFAPSAVTVTTGIYAVTLVDAVNTQHTLRFEDYPSTLSSDLIVNRAGERATTRVFFGRPGTYTFFCVVTGHRAAGMSGTVTVTGPPLSLAEAEAEATRESAHG